MARKQQPTTPKATATHRRPHDTCCRPHPRRFGIIDASPCDRAGACARRPSLRRPYLHEGIGARQPPRAKVIRRATPPALPPAAHIASSLMLIIGSRIETMIPAISSAMMTVIAGTSSVSNRWMLR